MAKGGAKQINRAEIVDQNLMRFIGEYRVPKQATPLQQYGLTEQDLGQLLESQFRSRQLDLMARKLKLENKVFYTIGSSGHEGNAMLGRATRYTDPAFLHYRSGGFMMERSRQVPGVDPIWDTCLSFAASKNDPASGGRHKVWGSKPLWVLPQTSTIASHLPKAVGAALGIELAQRSGNNLDIPDDAIIVCNFGDASSNHSTAQGAFNAASWAAFQGLNVPILFVCEDNGLGISVKTPNQWIERNFKHRPGMQYFYADGLDISTGYRQIQMAVNYCRHQRKPVFLHLKTVRLMGHAGTDFEVDYRAMDELESAEAQDPLIQSCRLFLDAHLMTPQDLLDWYQKVGDECMRKANSADEEPRLTTLADVEAPLAPLDEKKVHDEAAKSAPIEHREGLFGSVKALPENQPPKHMAIQINWALRDLMLKYPQAIVFGEDVAQKGGVYTITKNLYKLFSAKRVFNTLLDEQTILGLAQGYAYMGMLPLPEIQYLAYFHNACDQIRGEAASLSFFSNGQFANPMVVRIPGLGYQKGFGGHFHNDNSITALRDIPGLIVACPSRGDEAVKILRTLTALAQVNKRVSVFLEPIALYMRKDLHTEGDGLWNSQYPDPDDHAIYGEPSFYHEKATDILIITYGNGVAMSLQAVEKFTQTHDKSICVMDLRWLQPLNKKAIVKVAEKFNNILVVDEGRASGGVGEGVITSIVTGCHHEIQLLQLTGADCFTPLGSAAALVLPDVNQILNKLNEFEN
ncbi:thiamine pyrophosphate-dependent enzyme [Marinicella sp. W31]|uniref:thiamine pyrophosphate-dependent enzyme n=1 Tax=Marinicella sp. W31 TaxID=3023713 RepID=UPI0037582946